MLARALQLVLPYFLVLLHYLGQNTLNARKGITTDNRHSPQQLH